MGDTIHIRRNSTQSTTSVDVDYNTQIEIQSTSNKLIDNSIVHSIDAFKQFTTERDECNNYRVILTVNPYCTNVLFNGCTEITRNEGSDDVENVYDGVTADIRSSENIFGKKDDVTRCDMIRNTEYSKSDIGYEYHPGMDFFNNHILRNKRFKVVNRLKTSSTSNRLVFNTISDYMRDSGGKYIEKCSRFNINDTSFQKMHLYGFDDIMRFDDREVVNNKLKCVNGWFGFYNNSTINTKNSDGSDMNISHALNNYKNCEFIDMYPDRTLFSFNPKYNKYKNRYEYNWKVQLTYPFECDYNHRIISEGVDEEGNVVNALYVASCEYVVGTDGRDVLVLRTLTKHNMNVQDRFILYYSVDNGTLWYKASTDYTVIRTGNYKGEYKEYFFIINDIGLIDDVLEPNSVDNNGVQRTAEEIEKLKWETICNTFYLKLNNNYIELSDGKIQLSDGDIVQPVEYANGLTNVPSISDAYIKVFDSSSSTYAYYVMYNYDLGERYSYVRMNGGILPTFDRNNNYSTLDFQKNVTYASKFLTELINSLFMEDDSIGTDDTYIKLRIAKVTSGIPSKYYVRKFKKIPNKPNGVDDVEFNKEQYKLGFANTIYGDDTTQFTFTDTVCIDGLKDNLGRDVSEIYATIVKNNQGHNKWYNPNNSKYDDEDIEFSHCFGNITSGFKFLALDSDTNSMLARRRELCDVTLINNSNYNHCTVNHAVDFVNFIHNPVSIGDNGSGDIDIKVDDDWFYGDIVEFNQMEFTETTISEVNFRFNTKQRELDDNNQFYHITYDEIDTDDFDKDGFNVITNTQVDGVQRHEGYYYKAHYRIPLRCFSPIEQDWHTPVRITNVVPIQSEGIFIKVKTMYRHGVFPGTRLIVMDSANDSNEWFINVVSVIDDKTFIMNVVDKSVQNYIDWYVLCTYLNSGDYKLYIMNGNIPDNAVKIASNTYLWRDVINPWYGDDEQEQIEEYPFANNSLYIDTKIDFFLRRQDPQDMNNLYNSDDVIGQQVAIETFDLYAKEEDIVC